MAFSTITNHYLFVFCTMEWFRCSVSVSHDWHVSLAGGGGGTPDTLTCCQLGGACGRVMWTCAACSKQQVKDHIVTASPTKLAAGSVGHRCCRHISWLFGPYSRLSCQQGMLCFVVLSNKDSFLHN